MNKYGIQFATLTNELEVLESGLVHITNSEVEFRIDNLILKCFFETDNGGSRYQGQVENGILVFHLYNFSNSLGEGLSAPLKIGTVKGRDLFFHFYVNTNTNGGENGAEFREFKYSFMLGRSNETAG
jgi:hypothetical protein